MYYSVSVDHNSISHQKWSWRVLRSAVYPGQWMGTDDMLWYDSEEDGNVRSECEEDEGTDCKDGDIDTDW